jgi:multidrug efflux pump subunit AcrB
LTDIQSRARDESAVLYLDFPFGTDPDLAFIEVNEKIDQAMNQLPRELDRPRVLATDVSDIPVVQLSVTLKDTSAGSNLLELSELARRVLRRRLEQQPEIAFADLSGQLEPRLAVRPDRAALRALGLNEAALSTLLQNANVELGGLLLNDGHYQYAVRFTGNLRTAEDLRQLYLSIGNDRIVPLGDLATVTYEPIPARGAYFHNGKPGVVFTIRKRANARLFDLRDNLQILLADLEQEYPRLNFQLDNDQTSVLRASIDNLRGGLLYGAGFAILVLFAFFRQWRRPLLIGLAVPIALVIAILGFYLVGLSINVISLAGLILGLGLMIDNSIIVLDNIAGYAVPSPPQRRGASEDAGHPLGDEHQETYKADDDLKSVDSRIAKRSPSSPLPRRGAGGEVTSEASKAVSPLQPKANWRGAGGEDHKPGEAHRIASATNEVIRPLLSSALTTIAVFLPLVLLSGVAGALFRDQAIAVSLALTASLLVAYFLLPMLSLLVDKPDEKKPVAPTVVTGPTAALRRPYYILPLLVLWIGGGYFLTTLLPVQGFPDLSRADFRLEIDWNEPLPLNIHRTRVRALNNDWRSTFGGSSAAFAGEDQFLLNDENRAVNAAELQYFLPAAPAAGFANDWLANWRAKYPDATLRFSPVGNLFDRIFLNDAPYLELRLRSTDGRETPAWETLQPLLTDLESSGFLPAIPARDEAVSLRMNYEQLRISMVDPSRLRSRLLTLFNENEVTRLRANDRALPVLLASADALTTDRLLAATVTNRNGDEIPLRYLIVTDRTPEYQLLTADRTGEYLALPFPGEPAETQVAQIREIVSHHPDFTAQLTGRFLTDKGRVGELGGVLLVSLLLLYLILAAQFEGLRLPFVVLLVVPVSLVGSLFALWITGGSLNLLSLIGMVVTGGIVVNDAIIKVDMIERARKAGLPLAEAIKEASRRRLRAIVMTSLTTVLALAPVLFTAGLGAELQQPLAVTVIGGLAIGTLGSLYVVPLLYRILGADAGAMEG